MSKQQTRLLQYLTNHRGITQAEAYEALGCLRLSERIRELVRMGYRIGKTWETGQNRHGERVRYMRYFLEVRHDGA